MEMQIAGDVATSDIEFVKAALSAVVSPHLSEVITKYPSFLWIGTGLSKIAASLGAWLVQISLGKPSQFMTPLEYCRTKIASAVPIVITLKGKNSDILEVSAAIQRLKPPMVGLLTTDLKGLFSEQLRRSEIDVATAQAISPPRDKRFVNCLSIFALSASVFRVVQDAASGESGVSRWSCELDSVLTGGITAGQAAAQDILSANSWGNRRIIVLGSGVLSPLSFSWVSILAEAGIGTCSVSDIKDFTHGDFFAAVRESNAMFVVLREPAIAEICDVFIGRYSSLFPVIAVTLTSDGPLVFWENLFAACEVAKRLSMALGYGGKRPPKHPDIWKWRGWGSLPGSKL